MKIQVLSPAERALHIPELLDMVFRVLDRTSLARVARVNRMWFNLAVPFIWKRQKNLYALLSLLAPHGFTTNKGKLDFPAMPTEADWTRFQLYSNHVRSLKCDDTDERTNILLDKFSRLRPPCHLFKSLRTVEWAAPTEESLFLRSILFMGPNVARFFVTLPPTYAHAASELHKYFDYVVGRMPQITDLGVFMPGCSKLINNEIARLVSAFGSTLETLAYPRHFTSSAILEAAASAPKLRKIYNSTPPTGASFELRKFRPKISHSSAFGQLERLELGTTYLEAVLWLRRCPDLPNLRFLRIATPIIETPTTIRVLFAELAKRLPHLHALYIIKCSQRPLKRPSRLSVEDCAKIDDIEPVFDAMPALTEFCFQHEFPLIFPAHRVANVGKKLGEIRFLGLNHNPDFAVDVPTISDAGCAGAHGPFPTLRSLPALRDACPHLLELALYIDLRADGEHLSRPHAHDSASQPFRHLEDLVLGGAGAIDERRTPADKVALYLSRLLRARSCTVASGAIARAGGVSSALSDSRMVFWEKVNAGLEMLAIARREEEVRVKEVEHVMGRMEKAIALYETALASCGVSVGGDRLHAPVFGRVDVAAVCRLQ